MKVLVINPGATSTKVAVFEEEQELLKKSIVHTAQELEGFDRVIDQADFRQRAVLEAVAEGGFRLEDFDAVCGRGGLYRPIPSGTYAVSDRVMQDVEQAPYGEHPSNLGAYLARRIGYLVGIPAFFVATIEATVSLGSIQREQQRRCVTVTAEVAEGYNVTKVTAAAQTAVAGVDLPQGITAQFSGENEAIMDAMGQLLLMLGLGVLLVYLVMVAQFQSLRSPLIVMFTIPLAFTGGFLALLISGIELSVVSLIGFVMLVGVIVNNGIVLVDYINQLRLSGMERREAIVEAGVTRLRPILMTSLTTILGLVVMAFGGDAGTALMQPVALVCIGGLLYATLMTLLVVPCMYDLLSRRELRKVEETDLQTLDI